MAQCTAKSKRSGERCRAPAMRGRTVCQTHGGKTPVGLASPHTKHGALSKYLKGPLATIIEDVRTDPELLNLAESIVLYHGRVRQLLTRLPTGEASRHWNALYKTWREFKKASRTGDAAAIRSAMEDHELALNAGRQDSGVWDDLDKATAQLAKLVGQENTRREKLNDCIPSHVVTAFGQAVMFSIQSNVTDPDARKAIQGDFIRALGDAEARAKGRD